MGGKEAEGQEEGKDGSGREAVMLFPAEGGAGRARCLLGQIASPSTAL